MIWLLLGVAIGAFLLWWLLVETEGVYLGRRVVIWLYDLYAPRYDSIKDYMPEYEYALLAVPIMQAIAPHKSPLVLDVATGTGRLPLALFSHTVFQGRVVGVDLSRRMLHQAAHNLAEDNARVEWVLAPAAGMPFHDASFDVVTCLESLEFMPDVQVVMCEMARVLRPGGLLLVTNRINTRWMPGKLYDDATFTAMLATCGFVDVRIEPWQMDYQRVWACRAGEGQPVGARPLVEVLCCPRCGGVYDTDETCMACGISIPVDEADIKFIRNFYTS